MESWFQSDSDHQNTGWIQYVRNRKQKSDKFKPRESYRTLNGSPNSWGQGAWPRWLFLPPPLNSPSLDVKSKLGHASGCLGRGPGHKAQLQKQTLLIITESPRTLCTHVTVVWERSRSCYVSSEKPTAFTQKVVCLTLVWERNSHMLPTNESDILHDCNYSSGEEKQKAAERPSPD